jgi:hypothetical protein
VNKKVLIQKIDKSIKRRVRLIYKSDPEEQEELEKFKANYNKYKFLYYIALAVYIFVPVFEKPSWCVGNSEIDVNTSQGKWYCQNAADSIVNSGIPKLPPQLTESVELVCLATMMAFLLARDKYRVNENKGLRRI